MIKTDIPTFKGKPIVEVPKYLFLRGDFGKAVLEEYNGRVQSDYKNNYILRVLSYNDQSNIVEGSNPFAVVLVNQILSQEGLRTAPQADLERILKTQALNLSDHYEDSGIVLRSENDPEYAINDHLARNLNKQIKSRDPKVQYPVMIPLNGLELQEDSNSEYGLSFILADETQIIYAPILKKDGRFSSKDIDENTGLPTRTRSDDGERYLCTKQDGLSGLCLNWGLYLNSHWNYLDDSNSDGRVVVVSDAVALKTS